MFRLGGGYNCDVVVCGIAYDHSVSLVYFTEEERGNGEDQYIWIDTVERKKEALLHKPLSIYACSNMIRKRLLLDHQIRFPEDLIYEDSYWVPLLHIYADHAYVVGKNLYHYFMHSASTVHVRNDECHLDRITVQMIKWDDYGKRGLLQIYREELEYDLLCNAIYFMRALILRYDHPSFSHYQLQREMLCERIPDYVMDSYTGVFSGLSGACFDALHYSLDQAGFRIFVENAKKMIT